MHAHDLIIIHMLSGVLDTEVHFNVLPDGKH